MPTWYPVPDAEKSPGGFPLKSAACTIVSPNYLHFARTLAASYVAQHPEQAFFVLIVADLHDKTPFEVDPAFTPVLLSEIGLADLRGEAMKYDILELNTNVKPTFMRHLLTRHGLDAIVYLDPDIFLYARLDPVFEALRTASAVLTPHMTAPVFDGHSPSEQDLLYNGTYNLGFIAVSGSAEGRRLLEWWEARCLALGFSEGRTGLFVDQKWANLMPGLFEGVVISRDPGLNMAYWNLHERALEPRSESRSQSRSEPLSELSGSQLQVRTAASELVPLRFFHFSGVDVEAEGELSRHTNRYTLDTRPDLQSLFAAYRATVQANRLPGVEALPYGFDRLSDGTAVTRLARRLYAVHQQHLQPVSSSHPAQSTDPFDAAGPFARFARAQGLIKGKVAPQKTTWKQFNGEDRRVRSIHVLLRGALRLLGPNRYELLMRYLAHISVLRHQAVFLRDPAWPTPGESGPDEQGSSS